MHFNSKKGESLLTAAMRAAYAEVIGVQLLANAVKIKRHHNCGKLLLYQSEGFRLTKRFVLKKNA